MKCHDDETCKHGAPDFVDCHECGAEALDRAVEMEVERKREQREIVKDFYRAPPISSPMENIHPYDVSEEI